MANNNNQDSSREKKHLLVMVNSANTYLDRRKSIRNSWMRYLTSNDTNILTEEQKSSVDVKFCLGNKEGVDVSEEVNQFHDIVFVKVEDSYANLARKTLEYMKLAVQKYEFDYFMHADDDSFIRMDLLLDVLKNKPREKYYYGYMWNNGLRLTKPLRNPTAKSYMPYEQYPEDTPYPPFACGCGFILSRDLVEYLAEKADSFSDYRLVDVAFGIYLSPLKDLIFENDERVRPYRPLPLFKKDSIIQHYMKYVILNFPDFPRPEEFRGFYLKAIGVEPFDEDDKVADQFYNVMAAMGLMKK